MIKEITEKLEKELNTMLESQEFDKKMAEITKAEDDESYKFKVVVTTEQVDRDWETIKAEWIDFKNYMKNPVVLVDHSYRIDSIVWKTLKISQDKWKTIAEWVFAKGIEKAELLRTLYNQGFVKTVSIWFIPKQRNEQNREVIEKSEMLEFSFVAVPANPGALSLDGKVYQKCLDQWLIKEVQEETPQDEEKKEEEKSLEKRLNEFIITQTKPEWTQEEAIKEMLTFIQKEIDDAKKESQEFDFKDIINNIKTLTEDVSEMKKTLNSFADDKASEKNSEKIRELGKELQKSLSAFNKEAKSQN